MIYQEIRNTNGRYFISDSGQVKSVYAGKTKYLKCKVTRSGYHFVSISVNNVNSSIYIHKAIAEAFIPNTNGYQQVNHINGVKTDNRIKNLEWCNPKMNIQHSWETGLVSGRGKYLTSEEILLVKEEAAKGKPSSKLALMFSVHESTIRNILQSKKRFKQSVDSDTDQLKTPAHLLNALVRKATEQRRRHWVEKRRNVSK